MYLRHAYMMPQAGERFRTRSPVPFPAIRRRSHERINRSASRKCVACVAGAIWFLILASRCFAAEPEKPEFKSLYDAHRWFELRDLVAKGRAPAFYKGAVACAFNDVRRCEKELRVKSHASANQIAESHRVLSSAYLRQGKYHEALAQVDALLAAKPGDEDAQNVRPLLDALHKFPDQKVASRRPSTVQLQEAGLPLSIHGVQGTYWFDTGANYSVMSESEANRFGLVVRPVSAKVGVSTGAHVETRIAVADELSIGAVRLRHVAFLVFPDDQPPFNQAPPGSRGLVRIPILLAFERFTWDADRKFEIGAKPISGDVPHSSLCFDGNTPAAQIKFENHEIAFILDTGATNTDLFPPFAALFPEIIRTGKKTDSYKMEGVGSSKEMEAATLESLHFELGNFPVVLSPAQVLLKPTGESSKFFQGNLGIDLLQQAKKVTFDFVGMTLTLQ